MNKVYRKLGQKELRRAEEWIGVMFSQAWRKGKEQEEHREECYGKRDALLAVKEDWIFWHREGIVTDDIADLRLWIADKAPEDEGARRDGWLEGGEEAARFLKWALAALGERVEEQE